MNLLIVDDNANNRMIISLLLEDFEADSNGTVFNIKEASNGLEAVDMCKKSNFDIVLMDIMMPEMDGIEATKIIREDNPNIMIIAVSAVDDALKQKKILSNGAEDYISKPINSDIFVSRISNYITLIEARNHKKIRVSTSKVNLFTDKIYFRHSVFTVNSEDSLSEFWEFFLLNAHSKYDNLSDVVRVIFSIAETQLKLSIDSEIYIEESDEYQYFTLTNIDLLPPKVVELILKKNPLLCPYKIEGEKISFELLKVYSSDEEEELALVLLEDKSIVVEEESAVLNSYESSKELQVFDYLDEEDLIDLEEYTSKLNSLMLVVGSGDITGEEFEEMCAYLEKLGYILSTYSEIHPISKSLNNLADDLSSHSDEFISNSEALGPMCKAFSRDMSSWIQMSFYTGAPSVDFMNDTIAVNCETISNMLKMNDTDDAALEELDDIFDF